MPYAVLVVNDQRVNLLFMFLLMTSLTRHKNVGYLSQFIYPVVKAAGL